MMIVLDTNIFYASTLRDPSFTALFDFLARSQVASLHIPQLVLDELMNKWKEAFDKIQRDLNRPLQEYFRWTGEKLASPLAADKAEQALAVYEPTIKDTLRRIGAVIRPYPTVSHQELVARCLARRKPFSGDGQKGYRDALIWATLLEMLAGNETEDVKFITRNSGDFFEGDKQQLHLHLVEDLRQHTIDERRITVFGDLHSFIDACVKPSMALLDERDQESVRSDLSFGLGRFDKDGVVRAIIRGLLPYAYSNDISIEIAPHEVGLPAEVTDISISNVEDLLDLHVRDARKLSSGVWFLEATATLILQLDFAVTRGDWYARHLDREPNFYGGGNDSTFSAQAVRPVQVSLTLTFDESAGKVTAVEMNSLASPFDRETAAELVGRTRLFFIGNPP